MITRSQRLCSATGQIAVDALPPCREFHCWSVTCNCKQQGLQAIHCLVDLSSSRSSYCGVKGGVSYACRAANRNL